MPEDDDPAQQAPLLCAGVTTFNAIRHMNISPGDIMAVQGLGGLGHVAIQYARKMGFRTVAVSSSASKKDFALQLGATDYIDSSSEDAAGKLQKMGGASLVLVTAPNAKVLSPLINALRPGGTLLIVPCRCSYLVSCTHHSNAIVQWLERSRSTQRPWF